ncbi:MAG: hypothetical protein HKL95_06435 [Phycisphaerae bacterium]|nr:hypothetical protein [Phycisphaerae bacterium]
MFVPEESWNPDRQRCRRAHVPESVVYRSKWRIALEQVDRCRSNGIRLDSLSFDEGYGGKPDFLLGLDQRGQLFSAPSLGLLSNSAALSFHTSPSCRQTCGSCGAPRQALPGAKVGGKSVLPARLLPTSFGNTRRGVFTCPATESRWRKSIG